MAEGILQEKKASKISSSDVPRNRAKEKKWNDKNSLESRKPDRSEAIKLHPSPKDNKIFTARWENYVTNIFDRGNFDEGFLFQLEVLCDLYVELDALNIIIAEKGYTYTAKTQYGMTEKVRPEVGHKTRVLAEIRNYSKMLGLLLSATAKEKPAEEDDDWD